MLNDFKEKQPIAYNIFMNEILNNHISHAYLIDENNNLESFDIVIAFVKEILTCNLADGEKKIICKRIDEGNYPEIRVIEPDGMLIKKQQILDLQRDFSMSPVEGVKRIYIIRDAEKMRSETANSMLKFLEEPDNDLVAILMTNNYNSLLSTIISRCQVIRLNNTNDNGSSNELLTTALNFVKSLEDKGIYSLLNEQELLFNIIGVKERDRYLDFFDNVIDIYYDILKILNDSNNITLSDYYDELVIIAKKNNNESIICKINLLVDYKDRIKNNVNINLLIDSLIVNVGGLYEGSRS